MSHRSGICQLIASCRLNVTSAALQPWHRSAASHSQRRTSKRVKVTDRDTDLINESLNDQFEGDNPYQNTQRQYSVRDGRIRARIDQAWHSIAERTPHIRDVLILEHGLEKTGEDVYDRGRQGIIYFDCEPNSLAYVQRYFQTAGRWLSHQLGDHLKLGKRPKFTFVYDGLTPQGEQLLTAMADATSEVKGATTTAQSTSSYGARVKDEPLSSSNKHESASTTAAVQHVLDGPAPGVIPPPAFTQTHQEHSLDTPEAQGSSPASSSHRRRRERPV